MESVPIKLIGKNGDIELYKDRVVIKRSEKALWKHLVYTISGGDKTIFLKDITGIKVINCNGLFWGYIQFTLPGSIEKTKIKDIEKDENAVSFGNGKENNIIAHTIKSEIERSKRKSIPEMVSGIYAGETVNIEIKNGQLAVGTNIEQAQSISSYDLKELMESLVEFQKGIEKLGLDPDYQNVVNGCISTAIIEGKKEEPQLSKVRQCFEKAIHMLKKAGKTILNISELYEPAKKIVSILKISASFLH